MRDFYGAWCDKSRTVGALFSLGFGLFDRFRISDVLGVDRSFTELQSVVDLIVGALCGEWSNHNRI